MHFTHRQYLYLSLPVILLSLMLSACVQNSLAYITNQGDNTVSVIDTKQQKVIKTIAVGRAPVGHCHRS